VATGQVKQHLDTRSFKQLGRIGCELAHSWETLSARPVRRLERKGPLAYDGEMSSPKLAATIHPIDSTAQKRCHCGSTAKWSASLSLAGAQINPDVQHEDLCNEHGKQFAAVHHLRFPPFDELPKGTLKPKRP
jgi:hypothetical protein